MAKAQGRCILGLMTGRHRTVPACHAPSDSPAAYDRSEHFSSQPMVDIVDSATRSRMMSGIRGRDTKPERLIRSQLHRKGFRFRINRRDLPGKPDIVFPVLNAVVMVHGCFWHGHDCPLFRLPGTRTEFWAQKIGRNRMNDAKVERSLLDAGWRIAVVWECALRGRGGDIPSTVEALAAWLRSDIRTIEFRAGGPVSVALRTEEGPCQNNTEPSPVRAAGA